MPVLEMLPTSLCCIFVLPCPNRWIPFLHYCRQRQMQINRHLCSVVWLPREAIVCKQRLYQDTNNLVWCSLEMALHYKYSPGVLSVLQFHVYHGIIHQTGAIKSTVRCWHFRRKEEQTPPLPSQSYYFLRCLNK